MRTLRKNVDEDIAKKNDTPHQSSTDRNVVADLELKNEKITHKSSATRNDCCINTKRKYMQLSQQHQNLLQKNEELELMLKDSQILNVELQRKVIKGMGTVQETLERLINRPISTNNLAHDEKLDYPPVAFKRLSDNQVHIGRDIWISSQVYDTILISSRSTSLFVKNMAVAVFGIDLLKTSTVKGKVSNRLKNKDATARPALDHTKVLAIEDIFRHWLEDKQKLPSTEINYLASLVPTYIGKKILS